MTVMLIGESVKLVDVIYPKQSYFIGTEMGIEDIETPPTEYDLS